MSKPIITQGVFPLFQALMSLNQLKTHSDYQRDKNSGTERERGSETTLAGTLFQSVQQIQ